MSVSKNDFFSLFNAIARHKNRYDVFKDFVTLSAISLHNACLFDQALEDDYLSVVRNYKKDEINQFCELFALLVQLYGDKPSDLLGELFMESDLGNTHTGQFFTPFHISELMARLQITTDLLGV